VSLTDAVVRDTRPQESDGLLGRAINVQLAGALDATRLLVDHSVEVGVFASGASSTVTLADAVIRETVGQTSDVSVPNGIGVMRGGGVTGARVVVERSDGAGMTAFDSGTIALEDVSIVDTRPRPCAATTCAEAPIGYGAVAVFGGVLSLERFEVREASLCGVFVEEGELDLAMGIVEGAEIGACVQTMGYDLARLMREVTYRDNVVNLDTTRLPVPPMSEPLGE
jgi:hypothetical protein